MLVVTRSALLGVLSLLLTFVPLSASSPAVATPHPPPADATSNRSTVTLSTTQWKAVKLVTKARNDAVTPGGASMDYAKVKRIFAVNKTYGTDWRRQMAAGYLQAGGRITDISKVEKAKVNAMRKKMYGKKRVSGAARSLKDLSPYCTGKSGKVVVNKHESHTNYNSCQTDDLVDLWTGCMGLMGSAVALATKKKVPKLAIPAYVIGVFCAAERKVLTRAQRQSKDRAVYIRMYQQQTYVPYPGGLRYYITYTVEPQ